MIGTMRKHQQWLWVLIVAAVVVSFVVFMDPSQRLGVGGGGDVGFGTLYGKPISREEYRDATFSVRIAEALRTGRAPSNSDGNARDILQRVLLSRKARDLGIQVGDDAVAAQLRREFKAQDGSFNYDTLISNVERIGVRENDFLNYIRQSIEIRHLVEVFGSSGRLVTPREAENEFRRQNEQYLASLVSFSSSNYLSTVTVTPEAVGQFYSNRLASYRVPERLVLAYVRFEATNHMAAAAAELAKDTDLTNKFDQFYAKQGADQFRDENGQVLNRDAAFRRVMDEQTRITALSLARQQAARFYEELSQTNVTPASFAALATQRGLALRSTPPFVPGERAPGMEEVEGLADRLKEITPEAPYLEPLDGQTAVFQTLVQARVPAEIPALDTIRDRVSRDYRLEQARSMARTSGDRFYAAATNGIAAGRNFADIAHLQDARVVQLPPFALASEEISGLDPSINIRQLKNVVFTLKTNEVSRFVPSLDGGFIVHLQSKQAVMPEIVRAGLNSTLDRIRQERQMMAFNEWFSSEFQRSGLEAQLRKTEAPQFAAPQ
jgi:hypothetical protein